MKKIELTKEELDLIVERVDLLFDKLMVLLKNKKKEREAVTEIEEELGLDEQVLNAVDQVILNTLKPEGELSRKSVKNLVDLAKVKLMTIQGMK